MFNLTPFSTKEPDIFDYFDALDRSFRTSHTPTFAQFRTDIYEKNGDYVLSAELPGFHKEEISIDLKDNVLTITASHTDSNTTADDKESVEQTEETNINYIHRERRQYNYKRSFNIEGIDTANIKASYTDGILELTLPKITPKEPERIKIDVV